MYTALEIAKYVITKCMKEGEPISNLQLQKILYFLQVSFLRNQQILFDEDFEAWQFGPVIPEIYNRYYTYGGSDIRRTYNDITIKKDIAERIDPIIERKRKKYPWDLVEETHKKKGAWRRTFDSGYRKVIPKEWIASDDTVMLEA